MNPATTPISDTEIDRLAWAIEESGLEGKEADAVRVADRARPAPQVSEVLVDVLADPAQPAVARIRAFGRVVLQLHRVPRAA